jgi:hypothetical protein
MNRATEMKKAHQEMGHVDSSMGVSNMQRSSRGCILCREFISPVISSLAMSWDAGALQDAPKFGRIKELLSVNQMIREVRAGKGELAAATAAAEEEGGGDQQQQGQGTQEKGDKAAGAE